MKYVWNMVGGKAPNLNSRDLIVDKNVRIFGSHQIGLSITDGPQVILEPGWLQKNYVAVMETLQNDPYAGTMFEIGYRTRKKLIWDMESFYPNPIINAQHWEPFKTWCKANILNFNKMTPENQTASFYIIWHSFITQYFLTTLAAMKKARPWAKISLYGFPYVPTYPLTLPEHPSMQTQLGNITVNNDYDNKQIMDVLPYVCPDVYIDKGLIPYDIEKATKARIQEVKRSCPGKEICAYVWWQWHAGQDSGGEFIDAVSFEKYIKALSDEGCSAILWAFFPTDVEVARTQEWYDTVGLPILKKYFS